MSPVINKQLLRATELGPVSGNLLCTILSWQSSPHRNEIYTTFFCVPKRFQLKLTELWLILIYEF